MRMGRIVLWKLSCILFYKVPEAVLLNNCPHILVITVCRVEERSLLLPLLPNVVRGIHELK